MSYLCYLCLFVYSDIKHVLNTSVGVLKEAGTTYPSLAPGFSFWWSPCCSSLVFCVVFILCTQC